MIGKRFIDGDKLLEVVDNLQLIGPGLRTGVRGIIEKWLKRQPKAPKLIGRQRAAEIVGVGSPYVTVLVDKGDLKPVKVEGGPDVYDEAEAKALAKQWKKRQRKRGNGKADA